MPARAFSSGALPYCFYLRNSQPPVSPRPTHRNQHRNQRPLYTPRYTPVTTPVGYFHRRLEAGPGPAGFSSQTRHGMPFRGRTGVLLMWKSSGASDETALLEKVAPACTGTLTFGDLTRYRGSGVYFTGTAWPGAAHGEGNVWF
jgi:hypothetical protein